MEQPIKDLKDIYRQIPTHESSLERLFTKFTWLVIAVCAAFILVMLYQATVPPTFREITPAEKKHVEYLRDKFKLRGHMWIYWPETKTIDYHRKDKWRTIS